MNSEYFTKILKHDHEATLKLFEDPLKRLVVHASFVKLAALYDDKINSPSFKLALENDLKDFIKNKTKEGKDADYFQSFETILNESADNFIKKYKKQMTSRILYRLEKDNVQVEDQYILSSLKINEQDLEGAKVLLEEYKKKYADK